MRIPWMFIETVIATNTLTLDFDGTVVHKGLAFTLLLEVKCRRGILSKVSCNEHTL
jgi:hypothetical protein